MVRSIFLFFKSRVDVWEGVLESRKVQKAIERARTNGILSAYPSIEYYLDIFFRAVRLYATRGLRLNAMGGKRRWGKVEKLERVFRLGIRAIGRSEENQALSLPVPLPAFPNHHTTPDLRVYTLNLLGSGGGGGGAFPISGLIGFEYVER